MKYIYLSLMALCSTVLLPAQIIDRSKAPKPGPAPVINIADPASFTLPNGLKVFVVTNTKLPQVSATLTIDRDPLLEGEKAGMLSMAGSLMRRGTSKMDKATLDESVDFLGGELGASATSVSASSLKGNFPKLLQLMADVALRPSFSNAELEKIRTQTLSGLAQAKDDPNSIAGNVSGALVYGKNHPYGEFETEQTVKNVTVADIKSYHSTYWKPNIAYLIFVGDITSNEAMKLATEHFGSWTRGDVPKKQYAEVKQPAKTLIAVVDRPSSVQSVISISSPVNLQPGTPDAIPTSVMGNVLGGGFSSRLNQNLREKYAFTYGAGGGVSTDRLVGSFRASASVRNEKTDSAVGQFLYEFNRIRNEAASDSEVTALKNYMSGGFARSLENAATVANFALNVARYNLPKDYYRTYLTKLNAVTPANVQAMANKYVPVNNLVITIVGNAKEIAAGLSKYGDVKFFDINGNEVAPPTEKKVDANVTATSVLQKAIEAYGGETAIAAIKDATLKGSVSMMGQAMQYEQKHVMPGGYSAVVKMGPMELMKQSKNGSEYSAAMQGTKQEVSADDKAQLDAKAALYDERYYLSNAAVKLNLKGIESVDGKDAYDIEIVTPEGSSFHAFYDVKTGLKVQEMRQQEVGPMGKVNVTTLYKEYKEFNGVKIPVQIVIDLGVMKQDISITEVKINAGLSASEL
ncbi:M16 family metallopeptidase [Phnomibacter ginsenosidimutans]|uniref:Insulinase family protein n=1 Tax=Phnomibacter ginsenosidimutans TaxID=2676868 RepID=A0A6I6GAW9_9BACT|nr:pitrilysin family protein [Phnomibacter ginsenosidimutans]QGW29827.1 insulinase family protein [Phnomibacter ginsenosidimutans]